MVRKDGRREPYAFETSAGEPTSVIDLSDEQARRLDAALSGTYSGDGQCPRAVVRPRVVLRAGR